MARRIHPIFLHLAGCLLFLSLPLFFSPESLTLRSYLANPPTQRDLIVYVLVLGVFYANYFLLIPKFYFPRRYTAFILLNAFCFATLTVLPQLLIPRSFPQRPFPNFYLPPGGQPGPPPPAGEQHGADQPGPTASAAEQHGADQPGPPASTAEQHSTDQPGHPPTADANPHPQPDGDHPMPRPGHHQPPPPNHRTTSFRLMDISQHLFLFLVVLFLALLLKIRIRWRRAEEEKLHAELAYLKTQINPHFLFNILNSIYALALDRSDRTAPAVVKLSSMMRYVLVEAGRDRVPLPQEIAYLTDYIQLQQTRFEDTLTLDFTLSGQPEGKTVAPLLFIPFIENAFKHGVNPEQPSAIQIRIDSRETEVRLQVTNKKVDTTGISPEPTGLGIKNTKQRLGILYPGRHTLHIEDGEADFYVSLTLQLT